MPGGGCRVVVSLDLDCFYAQCEELRDPSLAGKPVAVQQKMIAVTYASSLTVPMCFGCAHVSTTFAANVNVNVNARSQDAQSFGATGATTRPGPVASPSATTCPPCGASAPASSSATAKT